MPLQQAAGSSAEEPAKKQRRTLSCLPCRIHKLRCNRAVPCQNCRRHGRDEQCRLNPPPEAGIIAALRAHRPVNTQARVQPPLAANSSASSGSPQLELPLTPASGVGAREPMHMQEGYHTHVDAGLNASRSDSITAPPSRSWETRSAQASAKKAASPVVAKSSTVASALMFRPEDPMQRCLLDEPASYWKHYLVSLLPCQTQCDMMVAYFFENINWMYQSIHAPSFRNEYTVFWDTQVEEVDLIWLALLYMILGLGAFFAPSSIAEAVGFDVATLPMLHRRWYAASRQALHAGGHDSKPTLMAVRVFIVSQSYWYCSKSVEALNSHMGQTVRNAQALGLDKEAPRSITSCLEREMRHRLWWDLVSSDTFQSLCLGRPPLLQSHLSTVPFPSNCNDVDMTPTAIVRRSISEPTEMSIHCFRARIFKVFNKLYIDNGSHMPSYNFLTQVDAEISDIMDSFPWYLTDDVASVEKCLPPSLSSVITWARHILQTAICIQRVRMYRPFLNPVIGDSWLRCLAASTSALDTYKAMRTPDISRFQRYQKMHVHAYQVFSVAVALSTLLLVEMPSNPKPIRSDIELVLEDLGFHGANFDSSRWIPLISDGCRVIRRILALYDARCKKRQSGDVALGSGASGDDPSMSQDEGPTALVPAIYSVFGGEASTRRYLERCYVENRLKNPVPDHDADSRSIASFLEFAAWDALMDSSSAAQWNDAFWTDVADAPSTDS